jgi:hypothetical protein
VSGLVERIGNKIPGQLVRSEDWDMLVEAVDATNTRIDELVQSSCTVHADPGDDLQQAIAALPETGGELCLSAGVFSLADAVRVTNRRRVVVNGAGPATVLRCPTSETVLAFETCREVEVRNLRIEGGSAGAPTAEHLNGALTFTASTDIVVSACTLSCPDAPRRTQACLLVRGAGGPEPDRVRVERCELEVGAWQTGMLLIDVARAAVVGNRVRLPRPAGPDAVGQGIVVAGSRIGTVQLLDNVVEDAVQGIHVGAARGGTADAVMLARNVIHAFVPAGYRRDRHAVFVGNATSVHISGTIATLRRTTPAEGEQVTPVEAIRVHGAFGPFVVVRDTSTRNFSVGVRLVPLLAPSAATWVVADTMADGAAMGADVPESVEQERNRPAPPVRRVGPPARIVLTPAVMAGPVETDQTFTATVLDVAGFPVSDIFVRFAVTGANSAMGTAKTTKDGTATFTYTGTTGGSDTITAYADVNGNGQQDPNEPFAIATRTQIPREAAAVIFEQASVPATTNQPAKLAVVVHDAAGNPIHDVKVRFSVSGGQNSVAESGQTEKTTGSDGRAEFTYTGTKPGIDTVTAHVVSGSAHPTGTATVTYLDPVPARIVLTPAEQYSFRGTQHCVKAVVNDPAGRGMAGVTVVFAVTGSNRADAKLTTDAKGEAQFCYTGTNAGTDRITAFADANKNGIRDLSEPFAVASHIYRIPEQTRVLVPNLIGSIETDAVAALTRAGLARGTVRRLPDPTRALVRGGFAGPFVVAQSPSAGALVVRGSAVNLTMRREFEELGVVRFDAPFIAKDL